MKKLFMLACFIVHQQRSDHYYMLTVQKVLTVGVVICLTKQTRQVTYKHGAGLPVGITVQLKQTFERLSDDVLLSRCLDGKTQTSTSLLMG